MYFTKWLVDLSSYRLGALGFLTSEELRQAGFQANRGLRDQLVAMQWVQRHILDFGGDPDKVTLAGMSAGGGMCPVYRCRVSNSPSFRNIPPSLRSTSLHEGYCYEWDLFPDGTSDTGSS